MSLGQAVQQKGGPLALEGRGPAVVPGALALYFCTPQAWGLFPQQRKEVVDPEDMVRLVTARTDPPRPALRSGCSLLPAQCFSNHSSLWGYNPHVVKPTFEVCRSVVFSTFSVLCKSLLSDSRTFAHPAETPSLFKVTPALPDSCHCLPVGLPVPGVSRERCLASSTGRNAHGSSTW